MNLTTIYSLLNKVVAENDKMKTRIEELETTVHLMQKGKYYAKQAMKEKIFFEC